MTLTALCAASEELRQKRAIAAQTKLVADIKSAADAAEVYNAALTEYMEKHRVDRGTAMAMHHVAQQAMGDGE